MYSPNVPSHHHSMNFVPAVDKAMYDIKKTLLFDARYSLACLDELKERNLMNYGRIINVGVTINHLCIDYFIHVML